MSNQEILFMVYYLALSGSICFGFIRYAVLDDTSRLFILFLVASAISELISFLLIVLHKTAYRPVLSHVFSVVEILFLTNYFLKINGLTHHKVLIFINWVTWPVLAILNVVFLQKITALNTNMLMLESFTVMSLGLYTIFKMIREDYIVHLFRIAHFWIILLLLFNWSSTFFFWVSIKILYRNHWKYLDDVLNGQLIFLTLIYGGYASVFYFQPKRLRTIEHI